MVIYSPGVKSWVILLSKKCATIKQKVISGSSIIENVPVKEYNKSGVLYSYGDLLMEYLTTTEMAERWNISRRRVSTYCKEARIEGAVLKGKTWLTPSNTKKPKDPRHAQHIVKGVAQNEHRICRDAQI